MFNQKNLAIEVECCVDCHLHVWCSRHSEQKYNELYLKVQAKAQEVLKSYSIIKNKVPEHYRQKKSLSKMLGEHKYFDELQHEVVQFPRHGAFEISVNGMLIFSKLKSNLWPCIDKIGSLLQQIQQELEKDNQGDITKFSLAMRLQKQCYNERFAETYKKVINFKIRRPQSSHYSSYLNHSKAVDFSSDKKPVQRKRRNFGSLKKSNVQVYHGTRNYEFEDRARPITRNVDRKQSGRQCDYLNQFGEDQKLANETYYKEEVTKANKNEKFSPRTKKKMIGGRQLLNVRPIGDRLKIQNEGYSNLPDKNQLTKKPFEEHMAPKIQLPDRGSPVSGRINLSNKYSHFPVKMSPMVDKSDSRKPDKKGFPLPKAMIVKIRRNTEEDKEEKMPVETDSKLDTAKRTSKQSQQRKVSSSEDYEDLIEDLEEQVLASSNQQKVQQQDQAEYIQQQGKGQDELQKLSQQTEGIVQKQESGKQITPGKQLTSGKQLIQGKQLTLSVKQNDLKPKLKETESKQILTNEEHQKDEYDEILLENENEENACVISQSIRLLQAANKSRQCSNVNSKSGQAEEEIVEQQLEEISKIIKQEKKPIISQHAIIADQVQEKIYNDQESVREKDEHEQHPPVTVGPNEAQISLDQESVREKDEHEQHPPATMKPAGEADSDQDVQTGSIIKLASENDKKDQSENKFASQQEVQDESRKKLEVYKQMKVPHQQSQQLQEVKLKPEKVLNSQQQSVAPAFHESISSVSQKNKSQKQVSEVSIIVKSEQKEVTEELPRQQIYAVVSLKQNCDIKVEQQIISQLIEQKVTVSVQPANEQILQVKQSYTNQEGRAQNQDNLVKVQNKLQSEAQMTINKVRVQSDSIKEDDNVSQVDQIIEEESKKVIQIESSAQQQDATDKLEVVKDSTSAKNVQKQTEELSKTLKKQFCLDTPSRQDEKLRGGEQHQIVAHNVTEYLQDVYGSEVRKISTVKMIEEQSRGEDEYKNSDTIKGSESTVKTSEKVIVTAGLSQIYKKAINQQIDESPTVQLKDSENNEQLNQASPTEVKEQFSGEQVKTQQQLMKGQEQINLSSKSLKETEKREAPMIVQENTIAQENKRVDIGQEQGKPEEHLQGNDQALMAVKNTQERNQSNPQHQIKIRVQQVEFIDSEKAVENDGSYVSPKSAEIVLSATVLSREKEVQEPKKQQSEFENSGRMSPKNEKECSEEKILVNAEVQIRERLSNQNTQQIEGKDASKPENQIGQTPEHSKKQISNPTLPSAINNHTLPSAINNIEPSKEKIDTLNEQILPPILAQSGLQLDGQELQDAQKKAEPLLSTANIATQSFEGINLSKPQQQHTHQSHAKTSLQLGLQGIESETHKQQSADSSNHLAKGNTLEDQVHPTDSGETAPLDVKPAQTSTAQVSLIDTPAISSSSIYEVKATLSGVYVQISGSLSQEKALLSQKRCSVAAPDTPQ